MCGHPITDADRRPKMAAGPFFQGMESNCRQRPDTQILARLIPLLGSTEHGEIVSNMLPSLPLTHRP